MANLHASRGLLGKLVSDAKELTRAFRSEGTVSLRGVVRAATSDAFQILALTRLREHVRRLPLPGANHLLRRLQTVVYGIEINNDVTLGAGVDFVHPIGVVVGGTAQIGDRVRFMGSNTVGTAKENGYPIVEADVVVGAGARILGPIRVGARSVIGANAVVVHNIPPDSIVTGIPGRARPKRGDE